MTAPKIKLSEIEETAKAFLDKHGEANYFTNRVGVINVKHILSLCKAVRAAKDWYSSFANIHYELNEALSAFDWSEDE